ncbi:hypothetical protein [Actinomadura montaniterrae]|nr:hypothetical protein [Actinomadura montaniterrae]
MRRALEDARADSAAVREQLGAATERACAAEERARALERTTESE